MAIYNTSSVVSVKGADILAVACNDDGDDDDDGE